MDVELKLDAFPNSDYILSSRVGVEYKKVEDFVESIIDGRLLQQVKNLKNNFKLFLKSRILKFFRLIKYRLIKVFIYIFSLLTLLSCFDNIW